MTIIRNINGKEVKIDLTWQECQYIHEEWQKQCDIEDLEGFAEDKGIDLTRRQLEAVQKEYRKILDWNCGLDDAMQYAADTAIETIIGKVRG